jgi:hypothetical protein
MGFWSRFSKRKIWETLNEAQQITVISDVVSASTEEDVVLDDSETGKSYTQNDKGVWVLDTNASDTSTFSVLTWQGMSKGIEVLNAGTIIRMNDNTLSGSWDKHVYSAESYFGDVIFSFKMKELDGGSNHAMIGLNTDPATDADYSSIDYAFYINDGTIRIYESGTDAGAFGTFNVNSVYSISRKGTDIIYSQDNTELRRVTNASYTGNVYVDSSFHSMIEFRDIKFYQAAGSVSAGSGPRAVKTYTSNSTWTKPSWCNRIKVEVQGGGGGGCGYSESGGAGGYAAEIIDNPASSVSVTVGGAGSGTQYYSASGNGGTSSFGSYCSASGGYGANRNYSHSGGQGGIGSGGHLNIRGGGGTGHTNSNSSGSPAKGGGSYFGGGAGDNRNNSGSKVGNGAPGSGGPGARGETSWAGASGESGIVVVWEYE